MLKKIAKILLGIVIACCIVFAFIIVPNIPDKNICKGVMISVTNDENGNLTDEIIMMLLKEKELDPSYKNMDSISCYRIENFLNKVTIVKECQVYKGKTGYVNIDVECRIPILKVHENSGNSYYIDAEGDSIAGIHKEFHLPVASGHITGGMRSNELSSSYRRESVRHSVHSFIINGLRRFIHRRSCRQEQKVERISLHCSTLDRRHILRRVLSFISR